MPGRSFDASNSRNALAPPPDSAEHLWCLRKAGSQIECELRFDHESASWECLCFYNGQRAFRRRFQTRTGAFAEAAQQRDQLKREGWTDESSRRRERLWPFGNSHGVPPSGT